MKIWLAHSLKHYQWKFDWPIHWSITSENSIGSFIEALPVEIRLAHSLKDYQWKFDIGSFIETLPVEIRLAHSLKHDQWKFDWLILWSTKHTYQGRERGWSCPERWWGRGGWTWGTLPIEWRPAHAPCHAPPAPSAQWPGRKPTNNDLGCVVVLSSLD